MRVISRSISVVISSLNVRTVPRSSMRRLTFWNDPSAAAAAAVAAMGGIDVLVNNAGLHRGGLLASLSQDDWQAVLDRDYEPWDRERLILDSATLSVAQSVEQIIAALAKAS